MMRGIILLMGLVLVALVSVSYSKSNEGNGNSLFVATKQGNLNAVKEFIKKGADVNAKNESGNTALMIAAKEGRQEISKYLLEAGAKPKTPGNNGLTASDIASKNGHKDLAVMLLRAEYGFSLKQKVVSVSVNKNGEVVTSEMDASSNEAKEILKKSGGRIGVTIKEEK